MTCCIEIETIQHIKDTQLDSSNNPRDVISEALNVWNAYGSYTSKIHDRIWQDYRYRMIGTCDVDRWVQILGDRLGALSEVYVGRLSMQATVTTPDMGGVLTRTFAQRIDTVDRDAHDDTIDYPARTDTTNNINEDMPDTASPDTDPYTYPSNRSKTSNGIGAHKDTYGYGKQKDTLTYAAHTDTEHDTGSTAEHLKEYYKDLTDPLDDLIRDIGNLWLNMWC